MGREAGTTGAIAAGVGLAEAALIHLGRTYGSTRWERALRLPGDECDRIVPELRDIEDGTFIPDGPPETECGLYAVERVPERALVLRSNSHLPMSWRDRATLDWTWAFVLTPTEDDQRTRFRFWSRWVTDPWWFTVGGRLGVVPPDFVMSQDMLGGVEVRAEVASVTRTGARTGAS